MDHRRFKYRVPLALLLALLSGAPTLARNVECPAVWPGDSSKSKVKGAAAYIDDQTQPPWEESKHGIRVEDVVYGVVVDLQCLYTNGRTLFFPLHGGEKECHEIFLSPGHSEIIHIRTYCKLNAHGSADPAQGPFIMAELLTRHSDILGFRLDMSRAEIEAAIDQSGGCWRRARWRSRPRGAERRPQSQRPVCTGRPHPENSDRLVQTARS